MALLEPEVLESLDCAATRLEEEQQLGPYRAALRGCLEKVDGDARRILELRYGEKADVSRIARTVGRTIQASYAILKRTKEMLRECVQHRLSSAI